MKLNMKEIDICKVVQDLLPNYVENLTNVETNKFIENHLSECQDCSKIITNMRNEVKLDSKKMEKQKIDYFKKYNRKMKLWKKILSIIIILFIIYAISVIYKYNILSKIESRNTLSNDLTNYYYYSVSDGTIMTVYKKDGKTKVNLKQSTGTGDITFWKDSNTNEELCLWNEAKLYSENAGGIIEIAPCSQLSTFDNFSRFLISLNPLVFVGTQNYNDMSCYNVKFGTLYEIVDKETGLILYSNDNSHIRNITYKFNEVTNNEVEKPDLTGYTLNINK